MSGGISHVRKMWAYMSGDDPFLMFPSNSEVSEYPSLYLEVRDVDSVRDGVARELSIYSRCPLC